MMLNDEKLSDVGLSQSNVPPFNRILPLPYESYSPYQQLYILREKLNFLRSCTTLKRPPSTLRISGANAIKDDLKLFHFSQLETRLLGYAIKNKLNEVRSLSHKITSEELDKTPMPLKERTTLRNHFEKKISFYKLQEREKWDIWPRKTPDILRVLSERKDKNYKRRENQRQRRTEKEAQKALDEGSVVVLVDVGEDIPLEAIAVLNKGLGFVPTPKIDTEESRLDMRLTVNRIVTASTRSLNSSPTTSCEDLSTLDLEQTAPTGLPPKLSRKFYGRKPPSEDQPINEIINTMAADLDQQLIRGPKTSLQPKNLNKMESRGLKWLERMIKHEKLAIVAADKGGAVLLVDPAMLKRRTQEKLDNPLLYKKLAKDPTQDLHQELFDLWIEGKKKNFVTPEEARNIMGITNNLNSDGTFTNNKSTSSHFKPGKAYFYPALKIHKLQKEDLKPGVEPPFRLITALQDGITKRSDVFLADQYLKDLEKDFCSDLLTDNTDALQWLEFVDTEHSPVQKKAFRSFTYDFKALYDSLTPPLVIEALRSAMSSCREDWSEDFCQWLTQLVELSLRSSVGVFDQNWFIQLIGIPTGGSLCVQIANIAVYYLMNKCVYSNPELMKKIISARRYIDDGAGLFEGTTVEFRIWIADVNKALLSHGLIIDEYQIEDPGKYVTFLDIMFTFDSLGSLQTDFVKNGLSFIPTL